MKNKRMKSVFVILTAKDIYKWTSRLDAEKKAMEFAGQDRMYLKTMYVCKVVSVVEPAASPLVLRKVTK